jgi:Right handed beta helix region
MKRIGLLIFMMLFARCAFAQYGQLQFQLNSSQGQAISGATINVYTESSCGVSTGTAAMLYPSSSGGTPLSQPLYTNGFGYANAYSAQGSYTVVYYSPYTGTLTYGCQYSIASIPSIPVGIAQGGTGATTAAAALANLGGCALSGCTLTGPLSGTTGNFSTSVSSPNVNSILSVLGYGAVCNWNGTAGTDDTSHFQLAANAAAAIYTASGSPVYVSVPLGCEVAGEVTVSSGVHFIGPGSIVVPNQNPTTGPTLYFSNASNVGVENIVFTVNSQTGCSDNPTCTVIYWGGSSANSYQGVTFRGNKIHNSDWGISVFVSTGSGSGTLSDLSITDNLVDSPSAYTNGDGIHVGGAVVNYTVANNRVYNRGDAGIACTTEGSAAYINSGGNFTGNTLINDLVGLDNSGCIHAKWTGNVVQATSTAPAVSNPAARAICYGGECSQDVLFDGNILRNASGGTAYAVQVDVGTVTSNQSIKVTNNYISADQGGGAIAANGSGVTAAGNTIATGGIVTFGYDGSVVSSNSVLGTNYWEGTGQILIGGNAGLESNIQLWPQYASSSISYTNFANWTKVILAVNGTLSATNLGIGTASPASTADVMTGSYGLSTLDDDLGFNREAATGTIFSSTGYAYQLQHTYSTTNTSDNLSIQVYNPSGTSITQHAWGIAGTGDVLTNTGTDCGSGGTACLGGGAYFGNHLNQTATKNIAGACSMSTSTSCTFTLNAAFNSTPLCFPAQQSAILTGGAVGCTVSGTTVTITAATANSETWGAFLIGNPN